uniref:BZIP domain-containing protein n=1 Tax=Solanum lycopersicum TaxID=4081 RepID=A0A3Q7JND0_SOLLC
MADISPSTSTDADTEDKNRENINMVEPIVEDKSRLMMGQWRKDMEPYASIIYSTKLTVHDDPSALLLNVELDNAFLNQQLCAVASDGSDRPKDQKTLRRLAQNREAARKSRLRKKAYVQQLESSRMKLTQLEQELQRARQQGIFISGSGDQSQSMSGNDSLVVFIYRNCRSCICPYVSSCQGSYCLKGLDMYTFHEKERGSLTLIKKGEESEHKKGKKFILESLLLLSIQRIQKRHKSVVLQSALQLDRINSYAPGNTHEMLSKEHYKAP